jgi:hypothetical protein
MKISKQIMLSALCLMMSNAAQSSDMMTAAATKKSKNLKISIDQGQVQGPIAYGKNIPLIAQPTKATDPVKVAIPNKIKTISIALLDSTRGFTDYVGWMEFDISLEPTDEAVTNNTNLPPYNSMHTAVVKKNAFKKGMYVFVTVVEDVKNLKGRYFNINIAQDSSLKPIASYSFLAPYKGDGAYYYNMYAMNVTIENTTTQGYYLVSNDSYLAQKVDQQTFPNLSNIFFIQDSQKKLMGAELSSEKSVQTETVPQKEGFLDKIKDKFSDKVPAYLYYWPKLSLLYPIQNMSIQCGNQTFSFIKNSKLKEPQLFTRLSMIDKNQNDLLLNSQAQQNMQDGIYFETSYNSSTKELTVTSSENYVHLGKISNIGTATFTLDKAPQKITFKANGKSKTIKIGKKIMVTPWMK